MYLKQVLQEETEATEGLDYVLRYLRYLLFKIVRHERNTVVLRFLRSFVAKKNL